MRKAQAISTKRLQLTMTPQQRWNNVISSALDKQLRLNGYSEGVKRFSDNFIGEIDEACVLESEGHLYIFGDGKA